MHGWNGLGGTNYVLKELNSMDCEYVETHAGDTIYIPRSFVHVAEATSNEPSVHVTFGLQEGAHRWKDVITLAVESVVCLGDCDEHVLEVLIEAIKEISMHKKDRKLDANNYRWHQAFPIWACSTLREGKFLLREDSGGDLCTQYFLEFEILIDKLSQYVLTLSPTKLKGYIFHATRHHLKKTRTMGAYINVVSHMLGNMAQDIANNAKNRTKGNSLIPAKYAWAHQAHTALSHSDTLHTAGFLIEKSSVILDEVDERTVSEQRIIRRAVAFAIMDKDKNGIINAQDFKNYVSKFVYNLDNMFIDKLFMQHATEGNLSETTFLDLPPILQNLSSPISPSQTIAVTHTRLAMSEGLRSLQGKSEESSLGFRRPKSGRGLLAVTMDDSLATNVGSCSSSCDGNCGCDCCRGCDEGWGCCSCDLNGACGCDSSCDGGCTSFDCLPGSYKANGQCNQCVAGKYQNVITSAGVSACITCVAGKYASSSGQTTCANCPAGLLVCTRAPSFIVCVFFW